MRALVVAALAMGLLACDDGVSKPVAGVRLDFDSETIPAWNDSVAYVSLTAPGRVDVVGFFTACSYSMTGKLAQATNASVVVDVEICLYRIICIENRHTRYRATIVGLLPGEHRIIMEHVVRDCVSGELLPETGAVLDSVVTVPP